MSQFSSKYCSRTLVISGFILFCVSSTATVANAASSTTYSGKKDPWCDYSVIDSENSAKDSSQPQGKRICSSGWW